MIEEPRWRRYLRLWGADVKGDVDEEMAFHVEQLIAEYESAGATREEAERRAHARFGDYQQYERTCIEIGEETVMKRRRRDTLGSLAQDVRYGIRQLRANGLVTVTALITIALGIGATTAIFSVVNAVLLRPLPYTAADRLVSMQLSVPEYRELQQRQRSYEALTVWASNRYNIGGESPEEVLGGTVQPAFFELLMQPALGRGIAEDESRSPVAVISDALWRRRFNASPAVLGQTLTMSGAPYTIIGVMPPVFEYPNAGFDVWVPFDYAMAGALPQLENRSLRIFRVLGRLRPVVTPDRARAELLAISTQWQTEYPETNADRIFELLPVTEQLVGDIRPRLVMLFVAVGFVLLIACANVANLLLGSTARRARELSVRRALGAPRGRLLRQLLTESVVLSFTGAAIGVAFAAAALRILPQLAVDVPRLREVALDVPVLLFALAASVLTALLFGIVPALQGSRVDLRGALQEGGRTGVSMRAGGRLRATLVAAEVAVSIVVLVGAGLLVHSLVRVLDQDIGLEPGGLVHANVGLFYFEDPGERVVRLEQALERVAALAGVTAVAGSSGLPPQTAQRFSGFTVPGREPDAAERQGAYWIGATSGYFATIGARLVRGREFEPHDRAGALAVAVINESLARTLFGDADPIGRQIRLTNPDATVEPRTIVGVVNDIRYQGVEQAPSPTIYTPFAQTPFLWAYLMVRTNAPAELFARGMRSAIGSVDARMAPSAVTQHSELVSSMLAQRRFITVLLGSFAALALVLAAVGIYGVTSTAVTQRRREIGVRMALGAEPQRVLRQVLGRALLLVTIGLAAGAVAALWLTKALEAMLYQVQPRDPVTFVAGAVLMIVVAVVASAAPALRATRVDPLVALREQ